ncbi:Putative serine/threonine-protein kinase [Arachis hypogaea]|nr:Putative serine/threonine-protein kinase [Arachis hypogaea]
MPVTLSLPRSRSRFPSSTPLSHRRSQIKPLPSAPLTRSPILPKRGSGECDYRRQSYSFGASPKITTQYLDHSSHLFYKNSILLILSPEECKDHQLLVGCYFFYNIYLIVFMNHQTAGVEDILMYTADQRNIQFVDEKATIKKMDVQASTEFLSELKVLKHVHHLNLVHLIGYCVEGSLSLWREPLAWSTRVQIALDSARGIEYIHEHTVPVYIHRDVKPANILIYKDFREKVANFGLTKLWEVGSSLSLHTRLVRTFGYMPPVYFWQSNQKKTSYKKSWLD